MTWPSFLVFLPVPLEGDEDGHEAGAGKRLCCRTVTGNVVGYLYAVKQVPDVFWFVLHGFLYGVLCLMADVFNLLRHYSEAAMREARASCR